jgi:hypothetical protein
MTLPAAAAGAPGAQAASPSADEAIAAFRLVEGWVRSGDVPDVAPEGVALGSSGASVTLRLGGRVVGWGVSTEPGVGGLRLASSRAWRAASGTLGGGGAGSGDDGLRSRALSARTLIELELAGERTPLVGETFEAAGARVSPGVEGVGMRVGEREEVVFAGAQIRLGFDPSRALRACAGALGLRPVELGELGRAAGASAFRFQTTHLAQPGAGAGPVFLHRGGVVVGLGEVTSATLRGWANGMAAHLASHRPSAEDGGAAGAVGMRGDYLCAQGRYEPMVAGPRAQAVAAWALLRYAGRGWVAPERAAEARRAARRTLEDLTRVEPGEADPLASVVSAAAWLLGASEHWLLGLGLVDEAYWDEAVGAVRRTIEGDAAWARVPGAERALVAYALARASEVQRERGEEESAAWMRGVAGEAVRAALSSDRVEGIVGLAPWIGWASMELSGRGPIGPALALRQMRSLCWEHQARAGARGVDERDMEGGIVFTRGGGLRPTWQTLRPLALIAGMLGDRRLTGEAEATDELASLRRGLRFLGQLLVRERELGLVVDRRRSLLGVRRAGWDWSLSLDATSLGLLAVIETLDSLASIAGRPAPGAGEPGRAWGVEPGG